MNTYTELQLREIAKRSFVWSEFWADKWFETNRQESGQYNAMHREHLRLWLQKTSRLGEPQLTKAK